MFFGNKKNDSLIENLTNEILELKKKLEKEAKEVLKKNISVQEETYKAKLAARKERMRLKRSGISGGSNDNSFFGGMQHPMTSRNLLKPRAF